jgi:glutathione S-transferase
MIELWELLGQGDRRYSVFSWRSRMALIHKELAFRTVPVLQTDKASIDFSGGKTVPVIRDGNTVIRDSWQIALHLEHSYPAAPSLFGGVTGEALCHFINIWVDRVIVPLAFKALACDAILIQDPADQPHFRKTVERFTGQSPEALKAVQGEAFARLAGALDPSRATLKRQAFLGGATPSYADYALFSVFQWARIVSPVRALPENDPMLHWIDTLLDLNQGYARDTTAFY